jgi:hypothetical protein
MAAQFLTISKLSNIINMITLGQQSGILRVIRGLGATREIGQIKFVNGTPTSALLGQLTGENALTVLTNWGECIYSFEELPSGDLVDNGFPPDSMGRTPSDPSYSLPSLGSGNLASGSWPSYAFPSTAPSTMPAMPTQMPTTNPFPLGPGGTQPTYQPGYAPGGSAWPPSGGLNGGESPYTMARQPFSSGASQESLGAQMLLIPRRTLLSERVDQLPLDRRERMVLLLVDGQRNLSDLSRLTRRTERELLIVLDYLAGLGLVELRS